MQENVSLSDTFRCKYIYLFISISLSIFPYFICRYIRLKFDQINQHFQNLTRDIRHEIKLTSENPMIQTHRRRFSKDLSNQYIIWTVM